MMARHRPLFLERRSYRRRRLRDAARLLPLLGAFLLLLPLLWSGDGGGDGAGTARDGLYLFAVWCGLVLVCAVLSVGLSRDGDDAESGGETR